MPEPGHGIFLFPLEDTAAGPLRRWLGRQAWLSEPVANLRYEADGDRIMFRLVDTPSMAWGVLDPARPEAPAGDFFLGFDGTDGEAWPTTIALLDFGQHLNRETSQLGVVRELIGDEALEAARVLRLTAAGGRADQPVRVPAAEVGRLIRRWGDLVIPLPDAVPSDMALAAAISEWSGLAKSSPDPLAHGDPPRPDAQ